MRVVLGVVGGRSRAAIEPCVNSGASCNLMSHNVVSSKVVVELWNPSWYIMSTYFAIRILR